MKRKYSANEARSAEEILRILAHVDSRQQDGGATISKISKETGVPVSTLYRWRQQRGRRKISDKQLALKSRASITECIKNLCDTNADRAAFISSLAFMTAWLRWPTNPELHHLGALSVATRYVRGQTDMVFVSELKQDLNEIFLCFMRIDDIIDALSIDGPVLPYLNEYNYGGITYTDRDLVAEIANYFVMAPYESRNTSTRPSLNKAFKLMEEGFLQYKWDIGESTFEKTWHLYAPSSPFIFVEAYSSPLEWMLDPTASNFLEAFDDLISDPRAVRMYLSQVKWAAEVLRERLDPRAVARVSFPSFPETLPATLVRGAELSDKAKIFLRSLR